MAKVSSSLEGFEATKRAFALAPESVNAAAGDVIAKSSFAVAQRSRSLAPVRTGKLRAGIVSSTIGLNGRVGTNSKDLFYWKFVEFGTVSVAARPFFRAAAEAEQTAYLEGMKRIGPRLERDMAAGRLL